MIDSGGDPNQHILDTLEQCISVIIEKRQPPNAGGSSKTADSGAPPADNAPSSSRLGSLDYARANNNQDQGKETTTREQWHIGKSLTFLPIMVPPFPLEEAGNTTKTLYTLLVVF